MADRTTKVTLLAAVGSYISDMQKAQTATEKVGKEAAETAAKLEKQQQAMTEIGVGVAAVGAIAAVAFGLAVSKFAEFDQAMSNVKAATQETAANMGLLREAALEAGASTVFSATEAANAIEELGKAGLSTEQILDGGLSGALDLAAAGQLEVAEAAGIAAVALKQFNLEGEDLPHVADLLAAGAGKAVGDVKDLADALKQVGLIANGAGQSIEDTTGVLAAFADAGLLGSDAGTSLKAALIALQAPTDKARKVMEEYNLSFYDTNGQMLSFDKIAGQLEGNLGGLTDETRNAALAQIFGNDALRVANVLYDEGADGIRKYIDQTNDSGYAAKVAADRLNNLTGDVEKLGGAIDTALIKSGSGMNNLLRTVTQGATGVVDAIGGLPDEALGALTGITGVVGAVGLVGGTALLAIPKIAQFRLALATLNTTGVSVAKGIGLASGALALAGIAFSNWAAKQAEATARTQEFQNSLDDATGGITDYTRDLAVQALQAEQSLNLIFGGVGRGNAADAAEKLGVSIETVTDATLGQVDALKELSIFTKAADGDERALQKIMEETGMTRLDAVNNVDLLVSGIRSTSSALEDGKQRQEQANRATEDGAEVTKTAAEEYQAAAAEVQGLNDELQSLIDTINEANGVGQDAVSANAAYQAGLAGITDEVARQKEAFIELQRDAFQEANGTLEGFVGTLDGFVLSLDETTEAGSANAAMLADVAGKAQAAAEAQLAVDTATVGAEAAADIYLDTLEAQRQAFIDSATEAGYNADEVQALADKVFALPDETTVKILTETAAAQRKLDQFITDNQGRTITIKANMQGQYIQGAGGKSISYAEGGPVRGPGTGTSDSIFARISNGEYITPARAAAIPANRSALDYMRRGGVIRGYADGGFVQPQYASSMPRYSSGASSMGGSGPLAAVNVFPKENMDEEVIGRAAAHTLEFELRRTS